LQSRQDLRHALAALTPDEIADEPADGSWSILQILEHVGQAEWWYLDAIGLAPSEAVEMSDPVERLNIAREQLFGVLPHLAGVAGIAVRVDELWSPRKVLRRALWHERHHTAEIRRRAEQLKDSRPELP
jgi:hypothetical protein